MSRLRELVRKREHLIAQSAIQREKLARGYRRIMRPIWFVEGGVGLTEFFRAHPVLAASMLPLLLKPMKFVAKTSIGILRFVLFRPTVIAGLAALLLSTGGGKAALLRALTALRQLWERLGEKQKQSP